MTTAIASPVSSRSIPDGPILSGIALGSFSALLLELALTRLFSVVLFYHFAFLAISIALLGLGAGGVFAYMWKARLARVAIRKLMAWICIANAVVVPLVLETVLHTPVSLAFSRVNVLRLTLIYLTSAVPFFLTGLQLSIVFAHEPDRIPRLYGADLAGGAAACLSAVPLLNFLGAPNTVLAAAFMAAIAATVWAIERHLRRLSGVLAGFLVVLIVANHDGQLADVVYAKGRLLDRSAAEFTRWNAISRVEVDRTDDSKLIVIDSDAATSLMDVDLQNWKGSKWEQKLMSSPPAVANVLRPHGDFAIIGPGGGVDVVRALAAGSSNVTGIEINPIITNTIMRGRYADFSLHLYERPQVHIHTTDGRSYLRNTKERFDVIQMTLVDTWASTSAGAFALSENNLYTVEAFEEYFEHLNPDGLLAVTRWEFRRPREALRVVSVAMEALHRLGVGNASKHFMVISQGDLNLDGIYVLVLAKKSAFTQEEESAVTVHLAKYPEMVPLYLPSEPKENAFSSLIKSNAPQAFAAQYLFNVSPVTDDAPFFFFTMKPGQSWGLRERGNRGIDWKVNVGVAVLGIILATSVIAVLTFLILPLAVRTAGAQRRTASLLYFVAVGLGYMLTEIAFIQRFVLFLGHPTYALTVVVFLLLLSSGIGSLVSRRRLEDTNRVWIALVVIIATLSLNVFVLPRLLSTLVGLPFLVKLLISGILLVPLGFVMGIPFPTGLRALASRVERSADEPAGDAIEWAWAMNAASSVLGSVLAMVIAIQFGLNVTLACGAFAYLIAYFLTGTLRRPSRAEAFLTPTP